MCVILVDDGKGGDGSTFGFERKIREVKMDVTRSEKDNPGFERSRMYHNAGLTRASVSVSCRVDCHGRRRYALSMYVRYTTSDVNLQWQRQCQRKHIRFEQRH